MKAAKAIAAMIMNSRARTCASSTRRFLTAPWQSCRSISRREVVTFFVRVAGAAAFALEAVVWSPSQTKVEPETACQGDTAAHMGDAMNAVLVLVTFVAGTTWGPQVSTTGMPGIKACNAGRASVAAQISKTATSNVTGEVTVEAEGQDTVVKIANGREMARLSCLGTGGRPGR